MCGIFISYGPQINFSSHKKLTNHLIHRGPDNQGHLKINDNMMFGHTRLSIIDNSKASNQPFSDGYSIVLFNGMIYNYLEIKLKLKNFYNFKTKSDTEVISAAYKYWGKKCFNEFNGMFSIVIYDLKLKEIIVARDRLGIKPLYYRAVKKNYYFSSEIKPLLKIEKYNQDLKTVYNYFQNSTYETYENTFFEEVKQFLPGNYYVFKNYKLKNTVNYWNLKSKINPKNKIYSIQTAKEIFANEFERIKNYYIRSDRKIGLLYSSGLDSNFILDLINRDRKNISLLLTFGFKALNIKDEIGDLTKCNIKSFTHRFDIDEFFKFAEKTQIEQEMPWGGPNVLFQGYLLNKAKKLKHNVVLSADGADEIFGGYQKYLNLKKINSNYINQAIDGSFPYNSSLFKKTFNTYKENIFERKYDKNIHNYAKYLDITFSKLPRNFRFSDRFSMNQSVELRYPFLDHKLIELSFRLSKSLQINNKENKIVLRRLFNYTRKKRHINSPQTEWFYNNKFKKKMYEICNDSPIFDHVLDRDKVREYCNFFYDKKRNNSFKLWQIYNYDLWLKTFF